MNKKDHVHSYIRVKLSGGKYIVYRCLHCSHYIRREFAVGRESRCKCGNVFTMTQRSINLAEPVCLNCRVERTANGRKRQAEEPTERTDRPSEQSEADVYENFGR